MRKKSSEEKDPGKNGKRSAVRRVGLLLLCAWMLLAGCGTAEQGKDDPAEQAVQAKDDPAEQAVQSKDGPADSLIREEESRTFSYQKREIWCENNGQKIYGIAYIPDRKGVMPLVIHAHELGVSHTTGIPYAERLAQEGYAVYLFDFRGGTVGGNHSDGDTVGMSVMTEESDLEAVLAAATSWDFVDPKKIFLLGGSQGGVAAALAGCRNADRVAGMILLYPAFNLPLDVHKQFADREEIPEEYDLYGSVHVGRNYAEDIWDLDLFRELSGYGGPVLLLHGDQDQISDLSLVERAAEVLPQGELHVLQGAGHGFANGFTGEALEYILVFMKTWC
ncbi:MAG: alpha/beta fold hydrolase [Eubacterium sp.]|nr:alpha/beta fold hydrolase [Eubacterium sp.]